MYRQPVKVLSGFGPNRSIPYFSSQRINGGIWSNSKFRKDLTSKRMFDSPNASLLRRRRPYSIASAPPEFGTEDEADTGTYSEADHEHAVISTFDLFSIGIGPSSSHTVGPMRAGNIFVSDLLEAGLLPKVHKIHISLYGSLALTGEGHMTPSAILLGLESSDVETVDPTHVPIRFEQIKSGNKLFLGLGLPKSRGIGKEIDFDYDKDFKWRWGEKLALHSNGMRFTVFDEDGMMLATNDMFSVGGGFVVNGALSTAIKSSESKNLMIGLPGTSIESHHPSDMVENLYYKEIRREDAAGDRRNGAEIRSFNGNEGRPPVLEPSTPRLANLSEKMGVTTGDREDPEKQPSPRYPFRDAASLLSLCHRHNLTIAQIVYENEKSHGLSDEDITERIWRIWEVMDNSILEGVQAPIDAKLPGALQLHRRAPKLYRRLARGLYPSHTHLDGPKSQSPALLPTADSVINSSYGRNLKPREQGKSWVHGNLFHAIPPSPVRRTAFPAMDHLSVYAIAVNETNAAGGRIVTAPTNGAAGIVPAVLKYLVEFISDDPNRDIPNFLFTAAALGMLYKRGSTISAAEGGCMAEVGVACSIAAGAFAACMGATPESIEQAAEIGIEHNLGLTCDPIGGLVQAPCIERNALGAIKAISSANLALSSNGTQKVRLDDAIRAMRVTAHGMRNEFKETSLSGLATSVALNIPVSVPDC
jgi:L-serine deaminase